MKIVLFLIAIRLLCHLVKSQTSINFDEFDQEDEEDGLFSDSHSWSKEYNTNQYDDYQEDDLVTSLADDFLEMGGHVLSSFITELAKANERCEFRCPNQNSKYFKY